VPTPAVTPSAPPTPPAAAPPVKDETVPPANPVTASGAKTKNLKRLSARLSSIDRDLRARIQTAANAALLRQLEKAGGKIRNKVSKDESLRTKIAMTRNEHVASVLGKDAVESAGLTASALMDADFVTLKDQFLSWTRLAQEQALSTAVQMAGMEEGSDAVAAADQMLALGADAAWTTLDMAMRNLAESALFSPLGDADVASMNPETMVPTGVIRCALGIAGGATEQDFGMVTTKTGAVVPAIPLGTELGKDGTPIGQIGTGSTISDLLSQNGLGMTGYTWDHGMTLKAFEPHLDLDGVDFATFDDPALANDGDFPDNAYFLPGDHSGCSCDWHANWDDADTDTTTADEGLSE
jgi:hypothetical protein